MQTTGYLGSCQTRQKLKLVLTQQPLKVLQGTMTEVACWLARWQLMEVRLSSEKELLKIFAEGQHQRMKLVQNQLRQKRLKLKEGRWRQLPSLQN
jgi:hypothetical protein